MKVRFLFGALATLALLGAGCSRTVTPPAPTASDTPQAAVVAGTAPQAEAPVLSTEPEPLLPPQEPPSPPPPPEKPKVVEPAKPVTEKAPVVTPAPAPKQAAAPAPVVAPKPTTHAVTIKGFAFGPSALTVKVGDTVVWTQEDSVQHNVVADDGSSSGPLLAQGQTYSKIFTAKGTFAYHCSPHPSMKASVIVE